MNAASPGKKPMATSSKRLTSACTTPTRCVNSQTLDTVTCPAKKTFISIAPGVVMKPTEQSSIVAAKLMDLIHESGIPDGVVNFLPGVGEEVGPELVGSPDVEMITFTGSRDVGLAINESASNTDIRQPSS